MAINVAATSPFDGEMKVPLGRLLITPGAMGAFVAAGENTLPYVLRHSSGDWGTVDKEDWAANDRALAEGERLLSAYELGNGETVWIITEWDRSATTILLPEDY
jgi:hypothetical protein